MGSWEDALTSNRAMLTGIKDASCGSQSHFKQIFVSRSSRRQKQYALVSIPRKKTWVPTSLSLERCGRSEASIPDFPLKLEFCRNSPDFRLGFRKEYSDSPNHCQFVGNCCGWHDCTPISPLVLLSQNSFTQARNRKKLW